MLLILNIANIEAENLIHAFNTSMLMLNNVCSFRNFAVKFGDDEKDIPIIPPVNFSKTNDVSLIMDWPDVSFISSLIKKK